METTAAFTPAAPASPELELKLWGNSLGVRIPASIARSAGLKVDQRVRLSSEGGRVIITPLAPGKLSLAQRLAAFDPAVHGGEAMASPRIGAERW